MKASRLAAWMFCAAVGGAWLASAAGVSRTSPLTPIPRPSADDARLDAIVSDVQAQAGRLRSRMSGAPAPEGPDRNPFAFAARRQQVRAASIAPRAAPVAPTVSADVPEPVLELIGVAETRTENGSVRTAMISGGYDELMMVMPGQRILSRYDVVAVGADAVELKDLQTGATRRLVLR